MRTLQEIEYTVSKTLDANKETSFYFQQPEIGEIKIEIEKSSWYTLTKNEILSKDKGFQFDLLKPDPFICLFFQIKGSSYFVNQQPSRIPEQHHSLNYLPSFEAQYVVDTHTHNHDFSIKVNPRVLTTKLLEEDIYEGSWQRIIEQQQPFTTLHAAKKMNPVIWDTLFQLLHCPYTGAVGKLYKELLVRTLFIHQTMSFREAEGKSLPGAGNKLQKRDIEVLHAIKLYLEQHYLNELSLDVIVKEFGINTFKLKYGFKKLFGTSVMQFIDDMKMAYAKHLLLNTDTEVIEIADQLGYKHYNNFSAAFKRKFGYSPAFFAEKSSVSVYV